MALGTTPRSRIAARLIRLLRREEGPGRISRPPPTGGRSLGGERGGIHRRIDALRPDARARWGRLTAHRMVCRLTDSVESAFDEEAEAPGTGPLSRQPLQWLVLNALPRGRRAYLLRRSRSGSPGGDRPRTSGRTLPGTPISPMRATRWMSAWAAALLTAAATACSDPGVDQSRLPADHRVATRYASALDVDLGSMEARPSGLRVQDLVVGDGIRADSGDVARVEYTGWLPSGVEFDRSRDGAPFEVALGYGRVIAGWDQGLVGMRVGGRRRLVVPPALGYGDAGRARIPAGSTLVFEVELRSVEDRTPR